MKRILTVLIVACASIVVLGQSTTQSNWQQEVNSTIDVKLNDVDHIISGEIAVEYTNNSPNDLQFIYFHLWPNAYRDNTTAFAKQVLQNGKLDFYYSEQEDRGYIDGLRFNAKGKDLVLEYEEADVAKVILNEPLKSGESLVIYTPFKVKIPLVYSRLGHKDQDYFMTQWFPKPAVYDVNGWNQMPYLDQGEFYSEFGSYTVRVTLPENYTIVATGTCTTPNELGETKEGSGDSTFPSSETFKTVEFTATDVHDFAWFASKRFGYVTKEVEVEGKTVLARVVAAEPNKRDLDHIETAIKYYSVHVGVYPYEHATVVHGELKAGGGMEYPMITLCDFMNEEVIVHEVGHNWFYGILGNNERRYPWMDESINSYYEGQAIAAAGGGSSSLNSTVFNIVAKDEILTNEYQAIGDPSEDFTNMNYGVVVYGIGANSFGYLKEFLGEAEYKKAMNNYYDQWKFKHPLPSDMKTSFEKSTGKDLSWFFDELINSNGTLDYGVKQKKEGVILSNKGDLAIPVQLAFKQGDKSVYTWEKVAAGESRIVTPPIARFDNVIIDENNKSQDAFSNNDMVKTSFDLQFGTGKDKKGVKEIYALPAVGWNAYDKWMLGLSLHNYSFSNKKWQYYLNPMYSFKQQSLVGTGNIYFTTTGKGIGEYTEIGVKGQRFHFTERSGLSDNLLQYTKVAPYVQFNRPKTSARSPRSASWRLQFDQIFINPQYYIEKDTLSGPRLELDKARSFATIQYNVNNKRTINPYQFSLQAEFGGLSKEIIKGDTANPQIRYVINDTMAGTSDTIRYFPNIGSSDASDNYLKLSGRLLYNIDIGIKDKPVELRFFGSYIVKSLSTFSSRLDRNVVGSVDGAEYFDYRFDDLLMHRNAETGMFRNQISNRTHFSRFVGPVAESDKWLLDASVTIPLPGKIPVKPYLEILTYNDIKTTFFNTSGVGFYYNVGLEFEVVPNMLEVFLNLAQSKEITAYQESSSANIDKLLERVTFVFNLNGFRPDELKRKINIF